MLIVLYQFTVKEGYQKSFETSWATVTEGIKRTKGSLGSRLHTTEDPLVYIAYAQWPSREVLVASSAGAGMSSEFDENELEALRIMKESALKIETLHKLTVCDDKLVTPF